MSKEGDNNKGRVAVGCYPFLLLGSSVSQASLGLFDLIILCIVFGNHPNTGFGVAGTYSLVPVSLAAIGLLVCGVVEAGKNLKILNGGEIVWARLCKIKEDTTHEDMEYNLCFEYSDVDGQSKRFQAVRDVDDLVIGQSFPVLINRELGFGLLEPNLSGGITFENVYGIEPISKECWIRILFIPLLTVVPLLGLIKSVSTFIQQATFTIGLPILYWWTIILQVIWFCSNRRYFSPGKPIQLNANFCNQ